MNWMDTLRAGWDAVRTHKLRSLLTMTGIFIGIASVMLTVGFGQGAQVEVRNQIQALGSNLLIISPGSATDASGIQGGFGSASTLTTRDAEVLAGGVVAPDVGGVAPATSSTQVLSAGSTTWTTSIVGTTSSWLDVRNRAMQSGRFISQSDQDSSAPVAVLGTDTAFELFGGQNAVGQSFMAAGTSFTVIGVLDSVGTASSDDGDDQVIIPMTTAESRISGGSSSLSTIYVTATSSNTLSAAYQETQAALMSLHGLGVTDDADFTISTQESLLETATETDRALTVLLAGIAGISLMVGGIGVMNIMLVSVTERIREIGLRKALGATRSAIRRQFLLEASMLGLAGGVLGAGLGIAGAEILPGIIDQPVEIPVVATVAAIATALGIGVAFGVYPASRASRLAPIDALRSTS